MAGVVAIHIPWWFQQSRVR